MKKDLARKDARTRIYNVFAVPQLLYGCETWSPKKATLRRIQTTERRYADGQGEEYCNTPGTKSTSSRKENSKIPE